MDERKTQGHQTTKLIMDESLGRLVTHVVLSRVVIHSRRHFGSFSEEYIGLDLEDGGGCGTSGSHWEKRLLMNKIITGSVDTKLVVSKMTLALVEDSGWYKVNMAEDIIAVNEVVKVRLEVMGKKNKVDADKCGKGKVFKIGDDVMVFLRRKRFTISTYSKITALTTKVDNHKIRRKDGREESNRVSRGENNYSTIFAKLSLEEEDDHGDQQNKFFDVLGVPKNIQVKMAAIGLKSVASLWWDKLVTQRVLKRFGSVGLKGMKGSKALFTLAQKTKNILSSNWQGQLNTIKADAKGSKEEIYSSRVKYMFKKDKPYIWVPEDDLHNVNAMIDERSSFSVTTPFPGPLGSILKAMKKSPARVALTGDVIALKEKRVRLANEMIRESMLVEHDTISNSCYAVSGVLSSSNLGFTSRSECLLELVDGYVQYVVYKLDLRSCAFIDINGCTHDVDLELIAAAKADPIAPFTATLIDGTNQSEIRRRALMLLCFAHFNANVRDAFLLSVDRTGFDIVGKVPSSKLNDCGSITYQWKEFRIPLKQEARDIGTFCEQLVSLEEETLKNLSSYSGLG
ncbi:unnamed protein product [Rhodiola kirilowii]